MRGLFRSIVFESAFYMLITGFLMGILFIPISLFIIGLPADKVYSFYFISMCIVSGLLVGSVSFFVFKRVVLDKINNFSINIASITRNILNYKSGNINSIDSCKDCYVRLYSEDALGELAGRYNSLIRVLRSLFWQHETMDKFFSILDKSLMLKDLDKSVCEFIFNITPSIAIEIYHLDKNNKLNKLYSKGIHTELTKSRENSLKDIISNRQTVGLKDKDVDIVEFGTGSIKPREIVYFPFAEEEVGTGVIAVYTKAYLSLDFEILIQRLLSEYILALKSSLSYERIQVLAAFDELTNIYNRRFGFKRLEEEYQRAKRTRGCICVIMFDIDHFKRVNDTYGHQAGDFVLSSFARILKDSFRMEDIVMRYGGEEFLCVISNAQADDAYQRAEQIRKDVQKTAFKWDNNDIRITVSCGVSTFITAEDSDKSIEDIIRDADEKLYAAKDGGRNRCVYS